MIFAIYVAAFLADSQAFAAAPNIIVIMTDDQEDTGSMAYMPKTHALLAEKGLTFTNSFVDLPLCAPSRASFLTGQSAHNTGIKANNPKDGGGWGAFKDKEQDALPVWLQDAGYKTALIGKYLNRYGQESTIGSLLSWAGSYLDISFTGPKIGNPSDWVPPGWDLWYAFTGSRARYYDYSINRTNRSRRSDLPPLTIRLTFSKSAPYVSSRSSQPLPIRSSCSSRPRPCTLKASAPFRRRNTKMRSRR